MTPAVDMAAAAGVHVGMHAYDHDPAHPSYGLEAAEALGVDPGEVLKTLVVELNDGELALAVVPVEATVDLKAVAAALGTKKVSMAEPQKAERATGYVVGGISPLGTRQQLRTAVDELALSADVIYCSGGRRGLDISLPPEDLVRLTNGVVAPIARWS
ncbi:MAG: Cys-tRNA(Pro) deacylase [Actinomycetota bacterium]|nr:Cys-tRNA(Pro) deacylase [Actinomycetota bacterium]